MATPPTGRPEGRPTKYKDEYCDDIVREAEENGLSLGGWAGKIGVARSQINEWMARYPEFQDAVARSKLKRLFNMELHQRNYLRDGCSGGQASLLQFVTKNVDPEGYRDRQELTGAGGKDLVPENADPGRVAAAILELLRMSEKKELK